MFIREMKKKEINKKKNKKIKKRKPKLNRYG